MMQKITSVQFTNNFCNNKNDDENDKIKLNYNRVSVDFAHTEKPLSKN